MRLLEDASRKIQCPAHLHLGQVQGTIYVNGMCFVYDSDDRKFCVGTGRNGIDLNNVPEELREELEYAFKHFLIDLQARISHRIMDLYRDEKKFAETASNFIAEDLVA
jgi:hypothetical protein